MIQVPKHKLDRVEYLLEQSVRGNHVLFDPEELRLVLADMQARGTRLSEADAYETEPMIERLLQESTLEGQRAYLRSLERPVFARVVMTYFCIVENALIDASEVRH